MRPLVYLVAATADGFIAHTDGSFRGFPSDDAYLADLLAEFPETFPTQFRPGGPGREGNRHFDAVLMGRKTYEVGLREGMASPYATLDQYVFSRTMGRSPHADVTLVGSDPVAFVSELKTSVGKAIWLCGGSALAGALFAGGLIDELIVKVNPVLFGSGIPLASPNTSGPHRLELTETVPYPSGHVRLHYFVH